MSLKQERDADEGRSRLYTNPEAEKKHSSSRKGASTLSGSHSAISCLYSELQAYQNLVLTLLLRSELEQPLSFLAELPHDDCNKSCGNRLTYSTKMRSSRE